jgi:valyl-tRNA synthetase
MKQPSIRLVPVAQHTDTAKHHCGWHLQMYSLLSMPNLCCPCLCAPGAYAGLDRFVAREQLWKDMEAAGLVIKKEAYTTR